MFVCLRARICVRSLNTCLHRLSVCPIFCKRWIWFFFFFFWMSVCMCVQVSCLSWYRIRPLSSASALDTTLLTSLFATRAAHSQKSQTSTDGPLRDRKIRPPECFIGLMPFFNWLFIFCSSFLSCSLPAFCCASVFRLIHSLMRSQRHISH